VTLFSPESLFYSYAMNTRLVLLLTSALGVGATVLVAATTRWQYGLALYAMTIVGLVMLLRRAAAKHRRSAGPPQAEGDPSIRPRICREL
jgi:membrane protein implicated in regulation of membrane protease activity